MKALRFLNELFGQVSEDDTIPGERPDATAINSKKGIDEAGETNTGLRITGDAGTLGILGQALELLSRNGADDDAEWADEALQAIRNAKDGNVTLPAYTPTPDLDSFDDDQSHPEDESY
jgi:hypothetical protein